MMLYYIQSYLWDRIPSVRLWEKPISLRVPQLWINSISNSKELSQVRRNSVVAAYLPSISRADSGCNITRSHGPPYQINSIAQVVDGENAFCPSSVSPCDGGRGPIMAMEYVWLNWTRLQILKCCLAEVPKPKMEGYTINWSRHLLSTPANKSTSPEVFISPLRQSFKWFLPGTIVVSSIDATNPEMTVFWFKENGVQSLNQTLPNPNYRSSARKWPVLV